MNIILDKKIKTIAHNEIVTVKANTLGTRVAEIFESKLIHHLPVVDDKGEPIGIISLGDYRQLQHHFTRFKVGGSQAENSKLLNSLLAKEIMTENPVCLEEDDTLWDAIDIFKENKIHSIIICKDKKVSFILTPIDILKHVVEPALIQK